MVTVVEYADLQCPACKQYQPIVTELLKAFPGQAKLVFKHFPLLSIHPNAMDAAIAAEAAGRQNNFFEYVDLVYLKQDEWAALPNPQTKFEEYATELGLDLEQFKKDQKDKALEQKVNDERNEGIANGVSGTPTFFVAGVRIENPASLDEFKKIINEALVKETGNESPTNTIPTTPPDTLPLQP